MLNSRRKFNSTFVMLGGGGKKEPKILPNLCLCWMVVVKDNPRFNPTAVMLYGDSVYEMCCYIPRGQQERQHC